MKRYLRLFLLFAIGFASWPVARFVRSEISGLHGGVAAAAIPPRQLGQKTVVHYARIFRHVAFMEWAKTHHTDLLFLGDSITDLWRDNLDLFNERFPGAANFGVSYDTIEDVRWRVEAGEIEAVHPKVIVLLIGVNNLWNGESEDQIVLGVSNLVALIRVKQPDVRIVLIGLLPNDKPVSEINARLSRLPGIEFIDFGPKLLNPDGSFNDAMQPDHLHLGPDGYRVWADSFVFHHSELQHEH
jgi:lysophospholipase L1-like esterase